MNDKAKEELESRAARVLEQMEAIAPESRPALLQSIIGRLRTEIEMTGEFENALTGFSEAFSERFNIPLDEARAQISIGFNERYEQSPDDLKTWVDGNNTKNEFIPWNDDQASKAYKQEAMEIMQSLDNAPSRDDEQER